MTNTQKVLATANASQLVREMVDWLFTPPNLNREVALRGAERLSALTNVVAAAEHLARPEYKERGGPDDWQILGARIPERFKLRRLVGDFAAKPTATMAIDASQVAAGVALLLPTGSRTRLVANGVLAATCQILSDRRQLGGDGSDHARTICNDMAFVARLGHKNPAVVDAALWGLGLQSMMSYTVSGAVKVMGPWWREGIAIERIMRTRAYGHEGTFKLARSYPRSTKALSHALVAFECAAPLVYLSRGRAAKPYAIGAMAMHFGIGHTMALGRFITSFAGMLSGAMYTAGDSESEANPENTRADLTPKYAAATLAAGLGLMALSVTSDRHENRKAKSDETAFQTSDGSLLYYRRQGQVTDESPVYLIENGVAGPREQYLQLGIDLADMGEVVTYHRAGIGPSQLGTDAGSSVEDVAARASELIKHIRSEKRPCVVIGHGKGCCFAIATAAKVGDVLDHVLLLDPPAFEEDFETSDSMVRLFERQEQMMNWGLGVGMAPSHHLTLPGDNKVLSKLNKADYRSLAVYLRDPTTWAVAGQEIRAIASSANAYLQHLSQTSCPITLVTGRSILNISKDHESQLGSLVDTHEHLRLVILEDEDRGDGFSVLSGEENRRDLIDLAQDLNLREATSTSTVDQSVPARWPEANGSIPTANLHVKDV